MRCGSYALWVHSFNFAQFVKEPRVLAARDAENFNHWAARMALILTEELLPNLQLAVVPHRGFGFLQWSLIAFSRLQKVMQVTLLPPAAQLWDMGI